MNSEGQPGACVDSRIDEQALAFPLGTAASGNPNRHTRASFLRHRHESNRAARMGRVVVDGEMQLTLSTMAGNRRGLGPSDYGRSIRMGRRLTGPRRSCGAPCRRAPPLSPCEPTDLAIHEPRGKQTVGSVRRLRQHAETKTTGERIERANEVPSGFLDEYLEPADRFVLGLHFEENGDSGRSARV